MDPVAVDRLAPSEATRADPGDALAALTVPTRETENAPRLQLVRIREVSIRYRGPALSVNDQLTRPEQAAAFARKITHCDAREHFHALFLDGRHRPIAYSLLSLGTATASLVHPREVFQPAVLVGAVAVIALHNHPSNDPRPSREDRELTERLADAGRVLGIELLDHVVWTQTGAWRSLRDDEPQLFSRRPTL